MGKQQVANINVDVNDLKIVICTCEGKVFEQVVMFRILPAIYSPDGHPSLLPVPCAMCTKCKAVYDMVEMLKSIQTDSTIEIKPNS
jgi:hypothetical protein